jgi:hypothetical protein
MISDEKWASISSVESEPSIDKRLAFVAIGHDRDESIKVCG